MEINTLQEKFVAFLASLYTAEQQFLDAQKQMLQLATSEVLKSGLEMHIEQSRQQISNLEEVFSLLGQQPQNMPSPAAEGLIAEGQEMMRFTAGNPLVLDCVIADIQAKVEHSEISCYRGLIVGAEAMGEQLIVDLLQRNLQQEEKMAQIIEQATPQLVQLALQQQPVLT